MDRCLLPESFSENLAQISISRPGEVYDGQYVAGRKEGEGTFIWTNGRRFTGKWLDGKQHGIGVFYTESGQPRLGSQLSSSAIP